MQSPLKRRPSNSVQKSQVPVVTTRPSKQSVIPSNISSTTPTKWHLSWLWFHAPQQCPQFHFTCRNCNKIWHFERVRRSRRQQQPPLRHPPAGQPTTPTPTNHEHRLHRAATLPTNILSLSAAGSTSPHHHSPHVSSKR